MHLRGERDRDNLHVLGKIVAAAHERNEGIKCGLGGRWSKAGKFLARSALRGWSWRRFAPGHPITYGFDPPGQVLGLARERVVRNFAFGLMEEWISYRWEGLNRSCLT